MRSAYQKLGRQERDNGLLSPGVTQSADLVYSSIGGRLFRRSAAPAASWNSCGAHLFLMEMGRGMENFTRSLRSVLLRTAFTLLYNQFAWAYDWVSKTFFHGQWRAWQRLALERLAGSPGPRVLELGFGTGDLQYDLLRERYAPVGIDLSAAMLRQARRKARRRGVAGWLRLARARAQALPFPAAHFDAVISTFPSDYIADPRTLAEVARVLRPGGRLVVMPGAWLLPTSPTNRLLAGFARLVYGEPAQRALQLDLAVARAFPRLQPHLEAHGFSVQVMQVRRPASVALIIVADKTNDAR
jgi:ubiquinone/menaquinone biosynthesis C-methylase UbiE